MKQNKHKYLRWVEISRSALLHNIKVVKNHLSKTTSLACVVKSNAYGHGLQEVSQIIKNNVDAFIIVELDEAKELRNAGIKNAIINIGYTIPEYAEKTLNLDVLPVVYSLETAIKLNEAGQKHKQIVDLIVKAETGMNRCGLRNKELDELMDFILKSKFINAIGLSTHFSKSDCDEKWTQQQLSRFEVLKEKFEKQGHQLDFSHTANTSAVFLHPKSHHNIVRLGIGLYGLPHSELVCENGANNLKPVLEYKSVVTHISNIKKGESVSYNGLWTAKEDAKIAIIPLGYADGFNRALSNSGQVLIKGKLAKIAGAICMNCFAIDISHIPNISLGDEVTLISRDSQSGITANDIAKQLNTINYEVITTIPEKIKRIIVK